jgi:hypothetical protein
VIVSFTGRVDGRSVELIEDRFHFTDSHCLFERLRLELVTAGEIRDSAEINVIFGSKAE